MTVNQFHFQFLQFFKGKIQMLIKFKTVFCIHICTLRIEDKVSVLIIKISVSFNILKK